MLERHRSAAFADASSWEEEFVTMQARIQDGDQQLFDEEQAAERYKQERDHLQREWDGYESLMPPDWQRCGDALLKLVLVTSHRRHPRMMECDRLSPKGYGRLRLIRLRR